MQKKTSGISTYLLVLIQIGLILTLLAWWGLLGKFLLPAVIQGQADWGKAVLLAVGLVILLPVGRWLLEETLREVQRSVAPQALQIEITRWGLVVVFAMTAGWIMQVVDSVGPVELESLPAGVRLRFLLAAGLPLVLIWAAAIAVGWRWGERLRALEETADEAGQRSLVDRRMRLAFAGVGKYALLTVAWLLFFAVAWWVRTRFFR